MTKKDVLSGYKAQRTDETLRRQQVDIPLFEDFLHAKNISVGDMFNHLEEWRVVTSDLVEEFKKWQLKEGYALGSINVRLATIKAYCRLAREANILSWDECTRIDGVKGYQQWERSAVDKNRIHKRIGLKKEEAISLSKEQVAHLKSQPDTVQGRRDALLMCLLLDHGLRRNELARLRREDLDVENGTLTMRYPRLSKVETHRLTEDTLNAAKRYLQSVPSSELLLSSVHRSGKTRGGMTDRSISERVRELGKKIGLASLAPEDCRHYWTILTQKKR